MASHEADNLILWLDNTRELAERRDNTMTSLTRHVCRGTFRKAVAARAFSYVTDAAAKDMARNFGERPVAPKFRREADREYVQRYLKLLNWCINDDFCADLPQSTVQVLRRKSCQPGGELRGRRRRRR
jgi:hypothetical protein